jgi:hypothetical protein
MGHVEKAQHQDKQKYRSQNARRAYVDQRHLNRRYLARRS